MFESKKINRFINDFEKKFGDYLISPPDESFVPEMIREAKVSNSDNFLVFVPEEKYSDWDLVCKARNERIEEDIFKKMDEFIGNFKGFSHTGLVLATSEKYASLKYHHVDGSKIMHFMGFMSGEQFAPFVDIIVNANNNLVKNLYAERNLDQSFSDWMILTAWRKLKNGSNGGVKFKKFLDRHILNFLDSEEKEFVKNNPVGYFEKKMEGSGYDEVVNFLK